MGKGQPGLELENSQEVPSQRVEGCEKTHLPPLLLWRITGIYFTCVRLLIL